MAMICKKCGAKMADGDKFCSACGASVDIDTEDEETRAKKPQYTEKQQEQETQQENQEPLTVGNYLLLFLILLIPIVNIMFLLLLAFGKGRNQNRMNFARAGLIYVVVSGVLTAGIFFGIKGMMIYHVMQHQMECPYYNIDDCDDNWDDDQRIWTEATP